MATAQDVHRKPVLPPRHPMPIASHKTSTQALFDKPANSPEGWPSGPQAIKHSLFSVVSDLAIDGSLLALSLAFLTFGITVHFYDQASTELHPYATSILVEAATYVRELARSNTKLLQLTGRVGTYRFSDPLRMCSWSSCADDSPLAPGTRRTYWHS